MQAGLEEQVARHYGIGDLHARILQGLARSGLDVERLKPESLAPIDEFHIGGRPATGHAIASMSLGPHHHVLDVGCGIGGATRYLASTIGCRATGIDLTPQYIEIAKDLARRTGLAGKIEYRTANALAMPFADQTFDAAITLHVAMNIADRAGLYREVARVLKPGAELCVYDVMKGPVSGLDFPVPWAETAETSHVIGPDETARLLREAGFAIERTEDRCDVAIAFFRTLAGTVPAAPPIGLHLLMGANAGQKVRNMMANIEQHRISPVLMIARLAG